jgi:ribose transport system permease protein
MFAQSRSTGREGHGRSILARGNMSMILIIAGIMAVMSMLSPAFLSWNNLMNLARQASLVFVLGAGETIVILTRGIDLSIGNVGALAGVATALMLEAGIPVYLCVAVGLLIGTCAGILNGLMVTRLRLPAFVATFGMMLVAKGLTVLWIHGRVIWGFPQAFRALGAGKVVGMPIPIVVAAGVWVTLSVFLKRTVLGRQLYSVGANPDASRVSGIRVSRILVLAYAVCGFMAALGTMMYISRLNSAKSDIGEGFEMEGIAAALIGGTSFRGGVGGVTNTVFGALVVVLLRNCMNLLGISPLWQPFVTGTLVILAVFMDELVQQKYVGRG